MNEKTLTNVKTRKTVRKWFWVWDFEKEEEWLNAMAQEGFVLVAVGFCRYTFEKCEPNEYTVRLEMHEYSKEYIDFMQDSGAEYIGRMVQWIYFRKKTSLGKFDIFSDIDSRIAHLKKINGFLLGVGILNLFCAINPLQELAYLRMLNVLCAGLLAYAYGRIAERKAQLQKERLLRE